MGRPKAEREPVTTLFRSKYDNRWHAFVRVGTKPDGTPDRRHRRHKDRKALVKIVLDLEDMADDGTVPSVGRVPNFGDWLDEWLSTIAPLTAGFNTLSIYESKSRLYLKPGLGAWPLAGLTPKHFTDLYAKLEREGLSGKTVKLAHETARLAMKWAKSYNYVKTNPVEGAAVPGGPALQPEPLDASEVHRIIEVVKQRRNHVRWWIAFLGLRQGEVLGLKWSNIDWDTGIISVQGNAQRRPYRHGCDDPVGCAAPHCKTEPCAGPYEHGCSNPRACAQPHCERPTYPSDLERGIRRTPCPPDCTGHARGCPQRRRGVCTKHKYCPPVCPPGCMKHASLCPQRIGGLIVEEPEPEVPEQSKTRRRTGRRRSNRALRTKTRAGERRLGLPAEVVAELRVHKLRQDLERDQAGSKWQDKGFVFATEFGGQINPRTDWGEWEQILQDAGVEHIELHGARHSGATFLLEENVDPIVAMAVMGWSTPTMAKRYQHVGDELLRDAADRVGRVAFPVAESPD